MDFWMFAMMLGGLGLFLFGMKMMSDALEASAGDKLRTSLEKLTSNRFAAIGVGAGVTAVIQSSSATTVMLVGFINAGLMTLQQALFVGMGANIGTTITAQIIAFNITKVAPVILFVGVLIIMFVKKRSVKRIGEIVGGLGILFFGMNVMSEALAPLREYQPFINALSSFEEPIIGFLVGMGVTALIQSSSATMGILQAFALQGIMGLDLSVYVILGLNIGTCVTAIIASIGGTKTAKRMALSLLFFNLIGAGIFAILLRFFPIVDWIKSWSPEDSVRQLANFHTFFNIINTVIFVGLPFVLTKLAYFFIRGEDKKTENRKLVYLASPLPDSPVMIVGLAQKEVARMGRIAEDNYKNAVISFLEKDEKLAGEVDDQEKVVNYLNHEITRELSSVSGWELSENDQRTVTELMHSVMNIERISDIAQDISEMSVYMADNKIKISKKGAAEMNTMSERVEEALDLSNQLIENGDMELAQRIVDIEDEVDKMEVKIKKNHIKRLKKKECTPKASTVFTDVVTMMERVADHAGNIAKVMLNDEDIL